MTVMRLPGNALWKYARACSRVRSSIIKAEAGCAIASGGRDACILGRKAANRGPVEPLTSVGD